MKTELKFGLEEVISRFGKNPASEIYKKFYWDVHEYVWFDKALDPVECYDIGIVNEYANYIRDFLLPELAGRSSLNMMSASEKELFHTINIKMVDAPPYTKTMDKIKERGDVPESLIKEHELIARYRRSLDVLIMSVYAVAARNCPAEIKAHIHNDQRLPTGAQLNTFVKWLKKHPKDNYFEIDDTIRSGILRYYQRIADLAEFYRTEGIFSTEFLDRTRDKMFQHLNSVFAQ